MLAQEFSGRLKDTRIVQFHSAEFASYRAFWLAFSINFTLILSLSVLIKFEPSLRNLFDRHAASGPSASFTS